MRIVVLGAGFGGLELTSRLSEEFGDGVELVLIDRNDSFVFGFSKLDVMFGRALPASVRHPYKGVLKPGVRFVRTDIRGIDPVNKTVDTDAGAFEADVLVVALGADLRAPPLVSSRAATSSTRSTARSRSARPLPTSGAVG
jgi:sulfide:quinone oxidoreductase